jgi:hypothetical protein
MSCWHFIFHTEEAVDVFIFRTEWAADLFTFRTAWAADILFFIQKKLSTFLFFVRKKLPTFYFSYRRSCRRFIFRTEEIADVLFFIQKKLPTFYFSYRMSCRRFYFSYRMSCRRVYFSYRMSCRRFIFHTEEAVDVFIFRTEWAADVFIFPTIFPHVIANDNFDSVIGMLRGITATESRTMRVSLQQMCRRGREGRVTVWHGLRHLHLHKYVPSKWPSTRTAPVGSCLIAVKKRHWKRWVSLKICKPEMANGNFIWIDNCLLIIPWVYAPKA